MAKRNVLFLHHSTGGNVVNGGLNPLIDAWNAKHGDTIQFVWPWSIPSGNYAHDWASDTFLPGRLEIYAGAYDLVIWKQCYPGSHILADLGAADPLSPRKSLENYKALYRIIRDRLDGFANTRFMAWTLPPLHRLAGEKDPAERAACAARASEFSRWMRQEWLSEGGTSHPNQCVFDFRGLVVGPDHYLREEYEIDHQKTDSHPNEAANKAAAPKFFEAIVQALGLKN